MLSSKVAKTPAERKRASRAAQSSEKKLEEKERNLMYKELKRAQIAKPKNCPKTAAERKRASRASQSSKEKKEEKNHVDKEENQTEVEKTEVNDV